MGEIANVTMTVTYDMKTPLEPFSITREICFNCLKQAEAHFKELADKKIKNQEEKIKIEEASFSFLNDVKIKKAINELLAQRNPSLPEKIIHSPAFFHNQNTLRDALKHIADDSGYSLASLRKITGVATNTWDKIMKGQINLHEFTIEKLKTHLSIPDRLFRDKVPSTMPLSCACGRRSSKVRINEDGSDPANDIAWINQLRQSSRERLKAETGR
jgi:hypothetical protein